METTMRKLLALGFAATVYAQTCQVTAVATTPPATGTGVELSSYSYCGGSLNVSVFIENVNYNKVVSLYYTNAQNQSTPLSVISLGYQNSIADTNYETWGANTPVYIDGVTELLNLTYQAVDIGKTYTQILDLAVTASGAPAPTLPSPPKPYATPNDFQNTITKWLAVEDGSESEIAFTRMFLNIQPAIPGAVNGTVVAARSGPSYDQKDPDYEYDWVRDSSLTMEVVNTLYAAASKKQKSAYESILFNYAAARAFEQTEPGLQTGLGEPKFYLNNTIFLGPWGRPQNDGPATAAITLIEFANAYLANGGSLATVKSKIYDSTAHPEAAPVQKDLLFVASNWTSSSFDLWEEESSDHFYTRMVQRRALLQGAAFATKMGDSATSTTLSSTATALTATLSQFWDPNRQILLYEYGPVLRDKSSYLDIAVILGVIHGYNNDGVYGYTNDQVLSSALRISTSFISVYPIAARHKDASGHTLAPPIGRYPEDVYNGVSTATNGGNPWYLATAAMAQFMYSASSSYTSAESLVVTATSKPFFDYYAPNAKVVAGQTYSKKVNSKAFKEIISALNGWGDAYMQTIRYYTPANGHLSEEIDRTTGVAVGAADLTWSYASLLTASFARAEAKGDNQYVRKLANLGVMPNT
nr:hypothetical protein B0A51_11978 [Rachicladosporium sp. CCFEE 5018]